MLVKLADRPHYQALVDDLQARLKFSIKSQSRHGAETLRKAVAVDASYLCRHDVPEYVDFLTPAIRYSARQ